MTLRSYYLRARVRLYHGATIPPRWQIRPHGKPIRLRTVKPDRQRLYAHLEAAGWYDD